LVEAARSPTPAQPAAPAASSSEPIAPRPVAPGASANNAPTQRPQGAGTEARSREERDKQLERRASATDALRPERQVMTDSSARSATQPSPTPAPATVASAPPATPAAQPANAAPSEAKPAPVSGLAESVGVSREVAAKQRAAGFANVVAGIEIQSPDLSYRWRILPAGGIQRSTDAGTTWSIIDPLGAARADGTARNVLTAGSAPSRDVCWIVGRAGIVLLSTNGATWQRRPFPESVDLTGVRASSATNAVVTAADGRRFVTIDAGATWNLVK
jgi:hypothetical protein